MANHCKVEAKKRMTSKNVTEVLKSLNEKYFLNNLNILYFDERGNKSAYGPHVWMIKYISSIDHQDYDGRIMWLNNSKSFEIRHGGGSNFIWWIDNVITNEIAIKFDGLIIDDGDGIPKKGDIDKYSTFEKYINFAGIIEKAKNDLGYRHCLQVQVEFAPPEFRFDTGKKVKYISSSGVYKEV